MFEGLVPSGCAQLLSLGESRGTVVVPSKKSGLKNYTLSIATTLMLENDPSGL